MSCLVGEPRRTVDSVQAEHALAPGQPGHAGGIPIDRTGVFGAGRAARERVPEVTDALMLERKPDCGCVNGKAD